MTAKKAPSKKTAAKKTTKPKVETPDPAQMLVPCYFNPQPDITAYEIAVLLPFILQRKITLANWHTLEKKAEAVTRHLTVIEQKEEDASKISG